MLTYANDCPLSPIRQAKTVTLSGKCEEFRHEGLYNTLSRGPRLQPPRAWSQRRHLNVSVPDLYTSGLHGTESYCNCGTRRGAGLTGSRPCGANIVPPATFIDASGARSGPGRRGIDQERKEDTAMAGETPDAANLLKRIEHLERAVEGLRGAVPHI